MFSSLQSGPHARRKKRLSNVYAKSYLHSSSDLAAIITTLLKDRLLPRLSRLSISETNVEIKSIFQACAIDASTAYTFGLRTGTKFTSDQTAHQQWLRIWSRRWPPGSRFYLQELPRFTSVLAKFGVNLVPSNITEYICKVNAWWLGMCDEAERTLSEAAVRRLDPGDQPILYERLKAATSKEGLAAEPTVRIDAFDTDSKVISRGSFDARNLRSPQQLEVASETFDQLLASAETLGITLTYITWELSCHPEWQLRLRAETRALGRGLLYDMTSSRNGEELPSAKLIDELPVLHAIIMETLRLHPAIPGTQPRLTPQEGTITLGKFSGIPGGIRVGSYAWCLHKNPDAYPESLVWRPERWMPGPESHSFQGPEAKERWFWAFGSGSRMCIGSHFAMYGESIVCKSPSL